MNDKIKSIRIKVDNPNLRQSIIIISANFLLWIVVILLKNNEEALNSKVKDIILTTRCLL